MRIKQGFVLREVCGERVIVGEGLSAINFGKLLALNETVSAINFGKLLALNETAAWLWQQALAMGDFTIEALAEKLCEEYDVTPDVAKADVEQMVAEWQNVGVVE